MERYGFHPESFWHIHTVEYEAASTRWTVDRGGKHFADFEFPLPGEYNVLNATAAAALAVYTGHPADVICPALGGCLAGQPRPAVRSRPGRSAASVSRNESRRPNVARVSEG